MLTVVALYQTKRKNKEKIEPQGYGFDAVISLKHFTDEKDPLLLYEISENAQYVFKSSSSKMHVTNLMSKDSGYYLCEEYSCFDSREGRTKNFETLTASVYQNLLKKQIPLATMECLQENSRHIELFWRLFNRAVKEANKIQKIFGSNGWVTGMAGSNFVGLEKLYGEGVTSKIKGCEFHYKDSVNKKARSLGEDGEEFKFIAINLLESSTPEVYEKVKDKMVAFINKKKI